MRMRRDAQAVYKQVYGIELPRDRFKPIIFSGSGRWMPSGYSFAENSLHAELSVVRYLQEATSAVTDVIILGASTIANPVTLLLIARSGGTFGRIILSASHASSPDRPPVVASTAALTGALLRDLAVVKEATGGDRRPTTSWGQIGETMVLLGSVVDRWEGYPHPKLGELELLATVWGAFVSRIAGSLLRERQDELDLVYRWRWDNASARFSMHHVLR